MRFSRAINKARFFMSMEKLITVLSGSKYVKIQ